jgi:hypothetical protein
LRFNFLLNVGRMGNTMASPFLYPGPFPMRGPDMPGKEFMVGVAGVVVELVTEVVGAGSGVVVNGCS